MNGRANHFGRFWLFAGYSFLYLPIFALIIYSFNDSKMVTLWGGFTFKWYAELAEDREVLEALKLSLKLAFATATSSVILGTLGAFALVRYKQFFGRTAFSAHLSAPLVVPEVITGLSLLLFYQ